MLRLLTPSGVNCFSFSLPFPWELPLPPGGANLSFLPLLGRGKKKKNILMMMKIPWGVPGVAQWKRVASMRMQVRSLALLSGLRIQRCCGSGVGRQL